jgi:hypothetical protein
MISAIGRQAVGYVFQARTSMLSTPPSLSEKPTKTPLVSGTLDLEKNLNILKQYYAIASLLAPEE